MGQGAGKIKGDTVSKINAGKRLKKGVFTKIKAVLERNRLGELLVLNGSLTSGELKQALASQRAEGGALGKVLIRQNLVSRKSLYGALAQQWTARSLIACAGLFLIFASFGSRPARADSIRDIPAQIVLVNAANRAFSPMSSYPPLFGSEERSSANLDAFTKWVGMFARFEAAAKDSRKAEIIGQWQNDIARYKDLPLEKMAEKVNSFVNRYPYILDNRNWGRSDYWETPVEFFERGGDCEDFAIAKYASLRALGVPEERLRIAIVHDLQKDIPHAVLVVYADSGALILDNQNERAEKATRVTRYRPIYTINRQAWWLHTSPSSTVIASR